MLGAVTPMDHVKLSCAPMGDFENNLHSSSDAAQSPDGSPRPLSGRLPTFLKSLKAKLGALSSSRSANNLQALAAAATVARKLVSNVSPSAQVAVLCQDTSCRWHCNRSKSSIVPGTSPDSPVARQDNGSREHSEQRTSRREAYVHSLTSNLCTAENIALMEISSSGIKSGPSRVTTTSRSGDRLLPSLLSSSPRVETAKLAESTTHVGADSASTGNRSVLAVSSALPSSMRRAVWAIEDYSVIRRLHKGTTSAVYRATCRRSKLPVALKVYFLSQVPANIVHMLRREIEIHSQLMHRHVSRLYAAFMDEGDRVVLVQEYAGQGDLYCLLQRLGGRMRPEQVVDGVLRPLLEALVYMHSRGLCHRDIKPENILFTDDWRLLVADFGVSIDLHRERAVTRAGTEGYMAPEVERCPLKMDPNENKDDPRYAYSAAVDIWAVGVLAYEVMVGFPPVIMQNPAASAAVPDIQGPTTESLGGFMRNQMTSTSLHFPASIPPAARDFILTALVTDPLERPTASQLLRHTWMLQQRLQMVETSAAVAPVEEGGLRLPAIAVAPSPPSSLTPAATWSSRPSGNSQLIGDISGLASLESSQQQLQQQRGGGAASGAGCCSPVGVGRPTSSSVLCTAA